MRLVGKFVLSTQALLQPVPELGEDFRSKSGAGEGDFALSRRNSRSYSRVVDADAATLLRLFEKPATIATAVARYSRTQGGDPARILEDALPLLRALIKEGLLEAEGSTPRPHEAELLSGSAIAGWTIARCIQSLDDTEVYQVRGAMGQWGAMKIARPGESTTQRSIEREARLLGSIAGASLPLLLATGNHENRPYLVTAWVPGIDAESAAEEIRREGGPLVRRRQHELTASILDAYAGLHEQGYVHGDIHSRNLLVAANGLVTILDLGYTVQIEDASDAGRAGVSFFFEPEFASAALRDLSPPAASFAGEQYSLASLLYLLLTGLYTQEFSVERKKMLTQLATGDFANGMMLPFSRRGTEPWPEVEGLLARALSLDPLHRFPSTREFAEAWRKVPIPSAGRDQAVEPNAGLTGLLREVVSNSSIGGDWMNQLPGTPAAAKLSAAAVNSGGAGVAYALYRIASATGDGELLAAGDAWVTLCVREGESAGPPPPRPADETPGLSSLHHHRPGCYVAEAVIAAARGDLGVQCRATNHFIAWQTGAIEEPDTKLDLTLGLAGSLLGAVFLLDAFPLTTLAEEAVKDNLRLSGRELYSRIWTVLDSRPPIGEPAGLTSTAIAHGWAGILYASLCWCAATGDSVPLALSDRLEQLAARGEPIGRGLHWPLAGNSPIPGWCNGSAGFVFLWTEAFQALGDRRFLDLAERAAWNTWETPAQIPTLCCGLAGQAYALLNFHRHSGDQLWLRRAKKMALWAVEGTALLGVDPRGLPESHPRSLYNGMTGIAALAADLEQPLEARMPFFERE